MKKFMITMVVSALLLSSCDSYTGAGAYSGAMLGGMLGSAIGDISGGWRGSDIGQIVGTVGGAVAGAAIGAQADRRQAAAVDDAVRERSAEMGSRRYSGDDGVYENRGNGSRYQAQSDATPIDTTRNDAEDWREQSGFNANNTGDDRITLGKGQQSDMMKSTGRTYTVTALPSLEIRNARFLDSNGDGALERGEDARMVFEIWNTGTKTVYGAIPSVVEFYKNRHIYISPSVRVESIGAGQGIRYTAVIQADSRLKDGYAKFCVSVLANGKTCTKVSEFNIPTKKE
ncbi:hypothetical protein [Prevotella sp. AGR2160]|uniref:hypothetical protein n=1 Tax=Prevotella sp. AGR2160 TaxID=1280674 RepID=UPI0004907DD2|nr:hypothetical protein [Prevotella sp. AGR2160]